SSDLPVGRRSRAASRQGWPRDNIHAARPGDPHGPASVLPPDNAPDRNCSARLSSWAGHYWRCWNRRGWSRNLLSEIWWKTSRRDRRTMLVFRPGNVDRDEVRTWAVSPPQPGRRPWPGGVTRRLG